MSEKIQFYAKPSVLKHRPSEAASASCVDDGWNAVEEVVQAAKRAGADVVAIAEYTDIALINATEDQRSEIERDSGVTLYPNYEYDLAVLFDEAPVDDDIAETDSNANADLSGEHEYKYEVLGPNKEPIPRATVKAWLQGTSDPVVGETGADGKIEFKLRDRKLRRVTVQPRENYWCTSIDQPESSEHLRQLSVERLEFPFTDSLAHFFPASGEARGAGIKVAIIDTGIDEHVDLPKPEVRKTILNANVTDGCPDNGTCHGTHIAGIIAGRGDKIHGIARAVAIMGYRVFADGARKALSSDISAAIDFAVAEGADIINLSLGLMKDDKSIANSINNAYESGVLVVAATGNDGKNTVRFPARLDEVVSVGAVGLINAFAPSSTYRTTTRRQTNGEREFVATFSNYEAGKVNCAGPGVAVISTVLERGYKALSGTSMATPAVAATAAVLLSRHTGLRSLSGPDRVNKLKDMLYNECESLDFDSNYVGSGVPTL